MLLVASLAIAAIAKANVVTLGDTTIITSGEDTVRFTGMNKLAERITSMLDDTVLNLADDDRSELASSAMSEEEQITERIEAQNKLHKQMADTVSHIVSTVMTGLTFIAIFSLLFYYLHRRRKYKMVEKAIENNYQLPSYIFGASHEVPQATYSPTPPPINAATDVPQLHIDAAQPPRFTAQSTQPVADRIDWHQMKGGFSLAVTGFALMLFFAVVGATPLACIFIILLMMGLGKMWLNYQDQKNAINDYHHRQAWYGNPQPQQPQQPQPQQPQQPQPDASHITED